MKKSYIYVFTIAFLLMGCDKFLDINPKGKIIPSTIEHYDLLLAPMEKLPIDEECYFSADDIWLETSNFKNLADPDNKELHLYSFSDRRFANPSIPILAWNEPYANIYVFNKVINEIDEAKDALGFSSDDKSRIKAEALYGRAAHYLFLVNMFAKHYDKASAASDPAVPIIKKADLMQKKPARASVAQVYEFIVNDLKEAIKHLPKERKAKNRPSLGAGYAMLARTFLFMGEYEKALKNAQAALAEQNRLSDYTVSEDLSGLGSMIKFHEPEQYTILFFDSSMGFTKGYLTEELISLFDVKNDVRFTGLLECGYDENWQEDCSRKTNGNKIEPNILPSVPEMYLIVAECHARANRSANALEKLNALRKVRIKGVADKTVSEFAKPEDLLKFVLEERRREMFMTGLRLFDIKRLNLDPRFAKTVIHPLGDKKYEAKPNSGKLVLPIPMNVQKFGSEK